MSLVIFSLYMHCFFPTLPFVFSNFPPLGKISSRTLYGWPPKSVVVRTVRYIKHTCKRPPTHNMQPKHTYIQNVATPYRIPNTNSPIAKLEESKSCREESTDSVLMLSSRNGFYLNPHTSSNEISSSTPL